MLRMVFALCLCGGMTGCATTVLTAQIPQDQDPFSAEGVVFREHAAPEEVAALPPGSRVFLLNQSETSRTRVEGEVLHAGPTGVALMNVTRGNRTEQGTPVLSKVPYVSRLFKNTSVGQERLPVYWVPIHQISTAQVLAPPPEGYVAPQPAINMDDSPMFERIGIDFDFNVQDAPQEPENFVLPQISQRHQTVQ